MNYIIYKLTNQINGKIYIGKHVTENINDGYFGSGYYLSRSVKKYGKENFKKEILFVFDNEEDMNAKEKELVNLEFVLRTDTYNLVLGGNGGQIVLIEGHPKFEETKSKIKKSKNGIRWWTNGTDTVFTKDKPGEEWVIGRGIDYAKRKWDNGRHEKRDSLVKSGGYRWWNNGVKNLRSAECPGPEWKQGRLKSSISRSFLKDKDYARKYDYIILRNIDSGDIFKLSNITSEFNDFCKLNKLHNIISCKKNKNYVVEDVILNPNHSVRHKKK